MALFVTFLYCKSTFGYEISCIKNSHFKKENFATKGSGEDKKQFKFCRFEHIQLTNASIPVTINASATGVSNDEIELVELRSTIVKFIPNQIFKTFPNMVFLYTTSYVELEELRPSFFKGAHNLTILRIMTNSITSLEANLFAEARNLEIINFQNNKIKFIHELAFNGLDHLGYLNLENNEISTVKYNTFSNLKSLNLLNLKGSCASTTFNINGKSMLYVETQLSSKCNLSTLEVVELAKKDITIKLRDITEEIHKETQKQEESTELLNKTLGDFYIQLIEQKKQLKENNEQVVLMTEHLVNNKSEIISQQLEGLNQKLQEQNKEQEERNEEIQQNLKQLSTRLEEEMQNQANKKVQESEIKFKDKLVENQRNLSDLVSTLTNQQETMKQASKAEMKNFSSILSKLDSKVELQSEQIMDTLIKNQNLTIEMVQDRENGQENNRKYISALELKFEKLVKQIEAKQTQIDDLKKLIKQQSENMQRLTAELNSFKNETQTAIEEIHDELNAKDSISVSRRNNFDLTLDEESGVNTTNAQENKVINRAGLMENSLEEQNLAYLGIMTALFIFMMIVTIYTCKMKKTLHKLTSTQVNEEFLFDKY